jgi:hypothetical protein
MLNSKPPVHQNVTIFGNGTFKEVIKVKRGYLGKPKCNLIGILIRGNSDIQETHQGQSTVAHVYNPSHSKGGDWEDGHSRHLWEKSMRPHLMIKAIIPATSEA